MSKELVLITGATGHIGFRTLVEVLKAGYRARITSRKIATFDKVKAAKSVQPYLDNLEFEEVPDVTAPGAYDKAVKNVNFVLHLASPLPDQSAASVSNVKKEFLEPAKEGTLNILRSAKDSKTIKRIVVTSSVVILDAKDRTAPVTAENLAPKPDPDNVEATPWVTYRASKTLAYHAAQEWVAENKPSWDLIDILPAYVQGRNELVTELKDVGNGSNDVMIDVVSGRQNSTPRVSPVVFVNDVAKLEVAALDITKGQTGDRFIAAYPSKVTWAEVLPVAKKLFPEAFEKGILSSEGQQESVPVVYDSSPATEIFGIQFAGFETMVESLVGQYIELKQGK